MLFRSPVPQRAAASEVGKLVTALQSGLVRLRAAIEKAEGMHHDAPEAAAYLTRQGAGAMEEVRAAMKL